MTRKLVETFFLLFSTISLTVFCGKAIAQYQYQYQQQPAQQTILQQPIQQTNLQPKPTLQVDCPALQFEHALTPFTQGSMEYKLQFRFHTVEQTNWPVNYVEVHWRIVRSNGASELEMNERMTALSSSVFERRSLPTIKLTAGDCLHYWFTFSVTIDSQKLDCDSAKFVACPLGQPPAPTPTPTPAPAALLQQPSYGSAYQQQPQPIFTSTQPIAAPVAYQQSSYSFKQQPMMQMQHHQQQQQQALLSEPMTAQMPQMTAQIPQCPLVAIQASLVPMANNEYKIVFVGSHPNFEVVNAEVHWKLTRGGASRDQDLEMNEKMTKTAMNTFERASGAVPLKMMTGDCVQLYFTYSVAFDSLKSDSPLLTCDSEKLSTCQTQQQSIPLQLVPLQQQTLLRPPQPITSSTAATTGVAGGASKSSCPLAEIQHSVIPMGGSGSTTSKINEWKVQFAGRPLIDGSTLHQVDLHWHIQRAGQQQQQEIVWTNERMMSSASASASGMTVFERSSSVAPFRMSGGDCLHYWFTYGIKNMDSKIIECETDRSSVCPTVAQSSL